MLPSVGRVAPLPSGEVALSRVRTSIEQYRAAADQPDFEERSVEAIKHLKTIGETEPKTPEEAEVKLQFLLGEDVGKAADPEIYPKIIMQTYLERLMLDF